MKTPICCLFWMSCAPGDKVMGEDSGEPGGEGLEFGDPIVCEQGWTTPTWNEVGGSLSLEEGGWGLTVLGEGTGMAVADLNQDGHVDVVFSDPGNAPVVSWGSTAGWQTENLGGPVAGYKPTVADLDGDGDLDLLNGAYSPPAGVYWNEPTGLAWRSLELPERTAGAYIREFEPADIDDDGDLDLYVLLGGNASLTDEDRADFLLRNDGTGVFAIEQLDLAPTLNGGMGFDSAWFDHDEDGDPDLYVVNDMGADFGPNLLLENTQGSLGAASESCACMPTMDGMSVHRADMNRDGLADLYLAGAGRCLLLLGDESGPMIDATVSLAANPMQADPDGGVIPMAWGGASADLDLDGWPEILVTQDLHGLLVLRGGDGPFTQVDWSIPIMPAPRSVLPTDLDDDGDLDLLLSHSEGRPWLLETQGCPAHAWLAVEGPEGARVVARTANATLTGWITRASSFGAIGRPRVHFGLGEADIVESLEVTLPSGEQRTSTVSFTPNRLVRVVNPDLR